MKGDVLANTQAKEEHRHRIGCLMYEVKKLKQRQVPEAAETPDDFAERLSEAEKNAREAQSNVSQYDDQIDTLTEEVNELKEQSSSLVDRLKNELRCVKHEVKKLKERPEKEPEQSIPGDLVDRLAEAEKNSKDAKSLATRHEGQISSLSEELKNVKANSLYERESQTISQGGFMQIPPIILKRLAIAENNASSARTETSSLMIDRDQMKAEIEKLKEAQAAK